MIRAGRRATVVNPAINASITLSLGAAFDVIAPL
jgi:hypothetical protein